MHFRPWYIKLKKQGKTDKEIAIEMLIDPKTLRRQKALYQIPLIRKPRRNNQGISEQQLQMGEKIGLTRRVMLKRRRRGWGVDQAISTPKQKRRCYDEC